MQEEKKSDKRQVVADALAAKLRNKYAKQDPQFADSITAMTERLLLRSRSRILESDIVALETVVKKMSVERQAKRLSEKNSQQQRASTGDGPKTNAGGHHGGSSANYDDLNSADAIKNELKKQDEWVMLNALTLVEYESDKERERAKLMDKKRMQRAWLDAQRAEKEAHRSVEKTSNMLAYHDQIESLTEWQKQEQHKKQFQHDQIMKVRYERDEQLRQQKLMQEQQQAKRKQEEAEQVERVQRELKRLDDEARRRREQQHERMKRLQIENTSVQAQKDQQREQEMVEDVKLMEAYARRLAREDEERMRALQGKLKRRDDRQHSIVESIQEQFRLKVEKEEKRAESYQRQRDAESLRKEQMLADKRHKEALERQRFLHVQAAQKEQRERQEIDDDLAFAEKYHSEGRAAQAAQKRQQMQARQQNVEFQEQLLVQMEQQKQGMPISSLHLPRTLMNSREKNMNAKLLQKLEDPEISRKVLKAISPPKNAPVVSTSFY